MKETGHFTERLQGGEILAPKKQSSAAFPELLYGESSLTHSKKRRSKSRKKDGFIVFCTQGASTDKAVMEGYHEMGNYTIILSLIMSVILVARFQGADHHSCGWMLCQPGQFH